MAKKLASILKADFPLTALAQLVQQAGRGRDTVLAHITPKEAKMLKDRGGRGSINPQTGLPEFEDGGFEPYTGDTGMVDIPQAAPEPGLQAGAQMPTPQQEMGAVPQYDIGGGLTAAPFDPQYTGPAGPVGVPAQEYGGYQFGAVPYTGGAAVPFSLASPAAAEQYLAAGPQAPATGGVEQQGFLEKLGAGIKGKLSDPAALAALGLGGFGVIRNAALTNAARRQAVAARQEQEQLAAPYRAAGSEAVSRAQRGELTAAGQQVMQAAQARAAQDAARRGGVGQQQTTAQLAALQSQLIEQQMQYGLRLSGIADQIVAGAIRSGLQADKEAQAANMNFFGTMMTAVGGLGRG